MTPLAANFLKLLARNRRLFALGDVIKAFRGIVARHRGEVTADVTSAHPLTETQRNALIDTLTGTAGGKRVQRRFDDRQGKMAVRPGPAVPGLLMGFNFVGVPGVTFSPRLRNSPRSMMCVSRGFSNSFKTSVLRVPRGQAARLTMVPLVA